MSFWHETRQQRAGGQCLSNEKNRNRLSCVRYPDRSQNETDYIVYGRIWIGEGEAVAWFPQGWVELWPKTPLVAQSYAEVRRLQEEFSEQIVDSINEHLYNKRFPLTEFVEAIEHPSGKLLARIYRHQDGKFEIDYLGWHPGRGGGWGMSPRFGIVTFATDLDSAREAASLEMEEFFAQGLVLKE